LRVPVGHPTRHRSCDYQVHVHRSCVAQTGNTRILGMCKVARTRLRLRSGVILDLGPRGSIRSQPFAAGSSTLLQVVMQPPHHSPGNHPAPGSASRTTATYHVQTSRLAPLYKIRLSALLLCAACIAKCIAKCSMCQRSMLPLQESEEQLDPRRVTLSG
jgi:hypothetical protein